MTTSSNRTKVLPTLGNTEKMVIAFHIGEEESEYVRVTILRDNRDGWFSAEVEVVVGGFRGSYLADFNSWGRWTFRYGHPNGT